jgi:catechol 2,3-dioxygenase-like lactoylglutathione lyase family enzyme
MRTAIVTLFLLLGTNVQAEEKQLDQLPLAPGAYSVDGKGQAFCSRGPGGSSLVVESAELIAVITAEGDRFHVDCYRADGVLRLAGAMQGGALVAANGGNKLSLTPEGGAVTMRLETATQKTSAKWARVTSAGSGVATGIGGVFMRAKDAKKLRTWYAQHLGLPLSPYGFVPIRWRELDDPFHVATTVWATFKPESTHFDGPFMVNYRVDHLDVLLKKLDKDGIKPERTEDEPGNGRFAWIRDGEGNLVELWEPPGDR